MPLSPAAVQDDPARACTHPVLDAADLGTQAPVGVRLLEEDWVLWRDAAGQAWAAPDRCPHRGARLSLGRVGDGALACPYHGWRFGAGGACVLVPAVPGWVPPASHGLRAVPVLDACGLLWLRPDGRPAQPPAFAAEADLRLRKLNVGPYEVATSAPRIVENFLDMAHFSFVHAGWLGDEAHAAVQPHAVSVSAEAGLWAQGCQAWQPQSNRLSTEGSWVAYDYRVPAPFTAVLEKAPDAQAGYRESIALFIQPQGQEACRVWFRLAVPDFESGDAQLRAFQDTIFAQDAPVLLSQRPRRLPLTEAAPVQEVHCAADRSSAAYRRYLRALGWRWGVC
ncbi:aromatic ring-hydroxylating oxygenase subunit alpha [Ideonella livida]|uniref:Aromatic ring-hydroxylating dioxygenase subunit alpha n=1 Tax=Ideonella livida TaxID=2707176 RepID=A0A7C9TK11_9BURK|nr:aromatic ring-hydroxylating dioxygenase subunit alpha [Ideonella livida]NDY90006.1 aromatic ring-hydroxylating dioxygenase subunit alpha [Ideonella livida]